MTAFPQFDSYINDENAKKALESYVGILQEAFKHYQSTYINIINKTNHLTFFIIIQILVIICKIYIL